MQTHTNILILPPQIYQIYTHTIGPPSYSTDLMMIALGLALTILGCLGNYILQQLGLSIPGNVFNLMFVCFALGCVSAQFFIGFERSVRDDYQQAYQ